MVHHGVVYLFGPDSICGKFSTRDFIKSIATATLSSGAAYEFASRYTGEKGSARDAFIAGMLVLLASCGHRYAGSSQNIDHKP